MSAAAAAAEEENSIQTATEESSMQVEKTPDDSEAEKAVPSAETLKVPRVTRDSRGTKSPPTSVKAQDTNSSLIHNLAAT